MSSYTQDMPPKGGYNSFRIEYSPLRVILTGRRVLAASLISFVVGHYLDYEYNWKPYKRDKLENQGARNAVTPILLAERDRGLLKQCKRNVEAEKELMRYYPGWEVGTLFGVPVFQTVQDDFFVEPNYREFCAHAETSTYSKYFDFSVLSREHYPGVV